VAKKLVGRGNRGYLEIIHTILSVCTEGALKTHVMFKCNLNSSQVQQYLEYLVDRGLLEKERKAYSSKTSYRTSERGRRYMRAYNEVVEMLKDRKDVSYTSSLL
jgi:predicted transcriptional regulator